MKIAGRNAEARGVEGQIDFVQADADGFDYPNDEYDVVTISYFRTLDRLSDVKDALPADGILFYQHHLRSSEPVDVRPRGDHYRFATNELLRACLDMTVLYYREASERVDGRTAATAIVIARNSTGREQRYPTVLG